MDISEKLVRTLADGEGVQTDADVRIQFAGREWSVLSFIGKHDNGGTLLIGVPDGQGVTAAEVTQRFLAAACACGLTSGMAPQDLLRMLAMTLVETTQRLAEYQAARGVPS